MNTKETQIKMNAKKGVSLYISWIFLMLLVITLSVVMFSWYNARVGRASEILVTESSKDVCNKVGIIIENICQNTQTLNINISNSKDIKIRQLVFGLFDLYNEPETKKLNITIYPGETQIIEILKQGTLYQVDVTPVAVVDGISHICPNSKVFKNNIAQC